jgi:hypothetical protein
MTKTKLYEKYLVTEPGFFIGPNGLKGKPGIDERPLSPDVWCDDDLIPGVTTYFEGAIIDKAGPIYSGIGDSLGVPHKHNDYDEIFIFRGTDLNNKSKLGCEVEYWLGEDDQLEKVEIDTPCCLYVPAGLVHHPLIVKNMKTPLLLDAIMINIKKRDIIPVSSVGRPTFDPMR